jgi:Flp pilus assembly protein TadB
LVLKYFIDGGKDHKGCNFMGNKIIIQQDKAAAKMQAKTNNKIANKQFNAEENRAKRTEKRQIIQEKKRNQEGVYKKIGPFTIKTWFLIIILVVLVIYVLIQGPQAK